MKTIATLIATLVATAVSKLCQPSRIKTIRIHSSMVESDIANVRTPDRYRVDAPDNETRPDPLAHGHSEILCVTVGFF